MKIYDMIVIGGGPGGYVSAIRGAQLGLSVALIEKEHLGGICLNWGCIPTKSLLNSAKALTTVQNAKKFGIEIKGLKVDHNVMFQRSRDASAKLVKGISHLIKKNKIDFFSGEAVFSGLGEVTINGDTTLILKSKNIVIATGASARTLNGIETDGKRVWNYKDALKGLFVPKKLLIVGSGAIGMEFASFYNSIGSKITVVESMDRILINEDIEISRFANKSFINKGIDIILNSNLETIVKKKNFIEAKISTEEKALKFDAVLVAVGIVGNSSLIGLENVGVKTNLNHIVVDDYCRTNVDGIYAIGDVAAAPWLAHKASHEGIMVAELIAGKVPRPLNKGGIANCTYSYPEIASIGLTEQQALDAKIDINVGNFSLIGNGKAVVLDDTDGFIKTIYNSETGELLGAHLIGPNVTELISSYAIGMGLEITEEDFINTVLPHPTLSEAIHESALDAVGKAIHV
ncbi:dihydrolipoyl dehydrogenase [Rhodobacteraceae bacterium]|nr:dihydrolipoyl dehydrogenase [Paracoccaceae bacterium]MDC1255898.1 dihydrolipoyl dehydrogenase [Paracoccaceae bacterium]